MPHAPPQLSGAVRRGGVKHAEAQRRWGALRHDGRRTEMLGGEASAAAGAGRASAADKGKGRAYDDEVRPYYELLARQAEAQAPPQQPQGEVWSASSQAGASGSSTPAAAAAAASVSSSPVAWPAVSSSSAAAAWSASSAPAAAASSAATTFSLGSSSAVQLVHAALSTAPSWTSAAPSSSYSSAAALSASATAATTAAVASLSPASFPPLLSAAEPAQSSGTPPHATLKNNLPLQLLLVIGAVVVFASLLAGLAWLCRSSLPCFAASRRRKARRKLAWSPGASGDDDGSEATFVGDDTKSVDAKKWAAAAAPLTPVPQLLHSTPPALPALALHREPVPSGRGWELFDEPVSIGTDSRRNSTPPIALASASTQGGNYAVGAALGASGGRIPDVTEMDGLAHNGWVPPVRQPSFIERLLQTRPGGVSLPNGVTPGATRASASDPEAGRIADPYTAAPASARRNTAHGARATLFTSVMSGLRGGAAGGAARAGRRGSMLDSDFEGTIGGRDAELPMARRLGKKDERFVCDASTTEGGDKTPNPGTLDGPALSELGTPMPRHLGTPRTPGLAGVGSAWARGLVMPPLPTRLPPVAQQATAGKPSLAELKRQQAEMELQLVLASPENARHKLEASIGRWMEASVSSGGAAAPSSLPSSPGSTVLLDADAVVAARALPRKLRRADTLISLTQSSVSSYSAASSERYAHPANGLSRMPSIVPRFAATTTLESWLIEEERKEDEALEDASLVSIFGKYEAGPQTPRGVYRETLSMRTGDSTLPPSYRSQGTVTPMNEVADDWRALPTSSTEASLASRGMLLYDASSSTTGRTRSSRTRASSPGTSPCETSIPSAQSHKATRSERAAAANVAWGVGEEQAEEDKRQVDRRQKLQRREQRQAARILALQQARAFGQQEERDTLPAVQRHAHRHTVLDMAAGERSEDLPGVDSGAKALDRSRSMASSVYSTLSGDSAYCAPLLAREQSQEQRPLPALPTGAPVGRHSSATDAKAKHVPKAFLLRADAALPSLPYEYAAPSTAALRIAKHRRPSAPALSPPDSPWTSDSEVGIGRWQGTARRPPGTFIVAPRAVSHAQRR
jgi:hypothetical protein